MQLPGGTMSYQGSPYSGFQDDYEGEDDGYDDIDEFRDLEDQMPSHPMDASDEDTEEASEAELGVLEEPIEIKEQIYQDKLASLKKQLQQLNEHTHPEYSRRVKKLEHQYHERLRLNKIYRDHMLECAEREYISERKAAAKEFDEKKVELKENLLNDLEEKRKLIEQERHSMELNGDLTEIKPPMTRKLRRRPNEPAPVPEKRRKAPALTLTYLLEEKDIDSDLRAISRVRHSSTSSHNSPPRQRHHSVSSHGSPARKHVNNCGSPSRESSNGPSQSETRVEDGKLLYERRWYHRGQSIHVEGREVGSFSASIAAIAADAIWVKKTNLERVRIYTSQLARGKITIKRRAS